MSGPSQPEIDREIDAWVARAKDAAREQERARCAGIAKEITRLMDEIETYDVEPYKEVLALLKKIEEGGGE